MGIIPLHGKEVSRPLLHFYPIFSTIYIYIYYLALWSDDEWVVLFGHSFTKTLHISGWKKKSYSIIWFALGYFRRPEILSRRENIHVVATISFITCSWLFDWWAPLGLSCTWLGLPTGPLASALSKIYKPTFFINSQQ